MMAKFQQQETNAENPEGESKIDEIVPQPMLPTLTTLSGGIKSPTADADTPDDTVIQLSPELNMENLSEDGSETRTEPSTMGASLSKSEEREIVTFLKGVVEEFKIIEWPSVQRVVRLTFVIVLTLGVAIGALYLVDGFFYRISRVVFEGIV